MKTFVGSSPLDISSAAPATMKPAPDPRQQMMLSGPIAGTLLRFAAPTIVVVTVQALVSVMETYFVGFLGTDALAGVAVVFPVIMLMQMMSAGGMGGGVASAVARALGAGRKADADALVLHSVIIAVVLGLIFTLGILFWGAPLYRLFLLTRRSTDALALCRRHRSTPPGDRWQLGGRASVRNWPSRFVVDDRRILCCFLPVERAGAQAECMAPCR
jgi:MatE